MGFPLVAAASAAAAATAAASAAASTAATAADVLLGFHCCCCAVVAATFDAAAAAGTAIAPLPLIYCLALTMSNISIAMSLFSLYLPSPPSPLCQLHPLSA